MENMAIIKNGIIIVGAGPTGLTLANQLMRFGVDYLILDQKSGPTGIQTFKLLHW
jgi:2-polyprenyl-6-methoxyphenol hydroxylase-like FAD-dependent oxidoreductase